MQHLPHIVIRSGNLGNEPLGNNISLHLCLGRAGRERWQQQYKLVTAETRQAIPLPHQPFETGGDLFEQPVTGGVAEGVVDGLEVIEIDKEQRANQAIADSLIERLYQGFMQLTTIGQPGQLVVISEILNTSLSRLALGDILEADDKVADHPFFILHRRHYLPLGVGVTIGMTTQSLSLPAVERVELVAQPPKIGPEILFQLQTQYGVTVKTGDLAEGVVDPQDLEPRIRDDDPFVGLECNGREAHLGIGLQSLQLGHHPYREGIEHRGEIAGICRGRIEQRQMAQKLASGIK